MQSGNDKGERKRRWKELGWWLPQPRGPHGRWKWDTEWSSHHEYFEKGHKEESAQFRPSKSKENK